MWTLRQGNLILQRKWQLEKRCFKIPVNRVDEEDGEEEMKDEEMLSGAWPAVSQDPMKYTAPIVDIEEFHRELDRELLQ